MAIQLRSRRFSNPLANPTFVAASVTTSAATDVMPSSVTGNGNVTSDGGAAVTERGFCWALTSDPTTSASKLIVAGTTGAYTGTLTPLVPQVTYHYRAYAITAFGTSYGVDTVFATERQPSFAFVNFQNPGVF